MDFKRILVVPQRGIGDLVHILPLINSLRESYHGCELILPVIDKTQKEAVHSFGNLFQRIINFSYRNLPMDFEERRQELYRGNDFKDKYKIDTERRQQLEKEMYEFCLSQEVYDLAIVPRMFRIETISSQLQLTLKDILKIDNTHIVDRNLKFADKLRISKSFNFGLNLDLKEEITNIFGKRIDLPKSYVVIILGAGRPTKKWTLEGNKKIIKFCKSKKYVPVLIGSEEDYSDSKEIEEPGTINLSTNSGFLVNLENSVRIFNFSSAVIGPDTGLTHLADAIGSKVIGLYGPTRPSKFAPYNNQDRVVSTNHLSGRMQDIKSEEVISKLEEVLKD
jgi:ADP-heptose:LPS heptosyltransferase